MNAKFSRNHDLMLLELKKNVPCTLIPTESETVSKFISKENKKEIVGYEIKEASSSIYDFLKNSDLSRKQKFAVAMTFIRIDEGKTQKELALELGISEANYKKIENATQNIGFETLDRIYNLFSNERVLAELF